MKTKQFSLLKIFVLLLIPYLSYSQVVNVSIPTGGFNIDAQPTVRGIAGDWVPGPGTGGHAISGSGTTWTPLDPLTTRFIRDGAPSNNIQDYVLSGKYNANPTTWTYRSGTPLGKDDMGTGMYHFALDGDGNHWLFVASDRRTNTGTSYLDIELLQGEIKAQDGGFTSTGPDGGRTENDLLVTVKYESGGSNPSVSFMVWKPAPASPLGWDYALQPANVVNGNAFALTNTEALFPNANSKNNGQINAPYLPFGANTLPAYAFVESAVNITKLLEGAGLGCEPITINSILIKTKTSTAENAQLKDFIEPQKVTIRINEGGFSYPATSYCKDDVVGTVTPTVDGEGTFSATPAGLAINANTGAIDLANSNPGTYTITMTVTSGGGCNIDPEPIEFEIKDKTAVAFKSYQTTICPLATTTYEIDNPAAGANYSWDLTLSAGAAEFVGGSTGTSVQVKTTACGTKYKLKATASGDDFCTSFAETAEITAADNVPPTWKGTFPADIVLECKSASVPPVTSGKPEAEDNCNVNSVTANDVEQQNCGVKVIQRTWTATDDCGNSISRVQNIILKDDEAPTIDVEDPSNVTASDNCTGTVVLYYTDDGNNRTYIAIDEAGNKAEATISLPPSLLSSARVAAKTVSSAAATTTTKVAKVLSKEVAIAPVSEMKVAEKELTVTVYPNPIDKVANFRFTSPVDGKAALHLFNSNGSLVAKAFEGQVKANVAQTVQYRLSNLRSGALIYKLNVGKYNSTGRLVAQ